MSKPHNARPLCHGCGCPLRDDERDLCDYCCGVWVAIHCKEDAAEVAAKFGVNINLGPNKWDRINVLALTKSLTAAAADSSDGELRTALCPDSA